jgi:hypothetical protein
MVLLRNYKCGPTGNRADRPKDGTDSRRAEGREKKRCHWVNSSVILRRLDRGQSDVRYGRAWAYRKTGKEAQADTDNAAAKAIDPKIEAQFARYGVK